MHSFLALNYNTYMHVRQGGMEYMINDSDSMLQFTP